MKKLYFILITALLPVITYAQANYHEGYLVKNTGDTVTGFINYRNWEEAPKVVEFKTAQTDRSVVKFKAADLQEFVITGLERYITYKGYISTDKNEFPDIPDTLDTSKRLDTVFLRQIYEGKYASLYSNIDRIKKRFFVAEPGSAPVELEYHQYYSPDRGEAKQSPIYRTQLFNIANKNQLYHLNAATLLNNARYVETDLEKFFQKMDPVVKSRKKGSGGWFYVGAGIDRIQTNNNHHIYKESKFSSVNYSPRINVGFEISNNPNVQKFIFRADLSFWYIKPTFMMNTGTSTITPYSFSQYNVALTPQILWNIYNTDKLKYFIGGGLSLNFSSYSNAQIAYLPETSWINFPFTTGVVLNRKIEIALSYSKPTVYSRLSSRYFENQITGIGVKYRFGGK